ncbi:DUF3106 domain-containing protein [Edaphobacter acidisoli]|nr:DUF3106 domain-containing protein [Edaphobacter acidisoli]
MAKTRKLLPLMLSVMLVSGGASASWGQRGMHFARQVRPAARQTQHPAQRQAQPPRPNPAMRQGPGQMRNQEHLGQWMQQHSNMSLADQQKALDNEPGFRSLPPDVQQRYHNHLAQLNAMPPAQRERWLARTEMMERLNPAERQQVRGAMQQLGSLPVDRRRLVARAFRDLREMPPEQRQTILNSDRFRGQFSDQERGTLSNLLRVEPYLPITPSNEAPTQGK